MANRLKKLASVQYTPGSPYVPGVPAYCTTASTTEDVITHPTSVTYVTDPETGQLRAIYSYSSSYESVTTTRKVCFPAVPEQLAVPGTATYTAVNGWNGGARSVDPLVGDGAFRFNVSANPAAVVVGLVVADVNTLPSEPSHAFYVHGSTVDVMEGGVVVATAPSAHATAKPLAISRSGSTVTYLYDGWTYTSSVTSFGAQYLDAAIYASGDYVDSPELLGALAGNGSIRATLPRLFAFLSDDATPTYAIGTGELPLLFGTADGLSGAVGSIDASLPLLYAVAADYAYSEARGTLPLTDGDGYGGFPSVSLLSLYGSVPPLAGWSFGLTGEVGSAADSLPLLVGLASDHNYGEIRATLPALTGLGLTTPDVGYGVARSPLLLTSTVLGSGAPVARISSSLELAGSVTLVRSQTGSISSSLAVGGTVAGLRDRSASIRSVLALGGTVAEAVNDAQYAVNLANGALTTYAGFDFVAFARAGQTAYAARGDGVYRLRPGDDAGQPIDVFVDFGETEFDTPNAKTVEAVFLGLTGDGDATVTLRSDGVERSYAAIPRGPLYRASAARGVTARRWNLTLDVAAATELELDNMEQVVAVATRRWTR